MRGIRFVPPCLLLSTILMSAGFYTFTAVPLSVFLIGCLLLVVVKQGFRLYRNISLIAVAALFGGYAVSWFWAVDRGMSLYGVVRFFPVVLYMLLLMQMEAEEANCIFQIVPWTGAIMTITSFGLQHVPGISQYIIVDGRLAGFFQYANTYALFLLIGLVVLISEERQSKWKPLLAAVLVLGVFASGSRTSFLLMLGLGVFYCIWKRDWRKIATTAGVASVGFGLSVLISKLGTADADRFLTTTSETGTFLVRLLYYKDALPVILKHPGGLGYLGYYLLQSSFQTGVYSVRFIHNELLQLFLDVGWIPTGLFCVALVLSFLNKETEMRNRLILFLVCAHAMIDFDLQFLAIWFLIIPAMDLWSGEMILLKKSRMPLLVASTLIAVWCGWLGVADCLFTFHNIETCLQVMPNHTLALIDTLSDLNDVVELEQRADQIIGLNPSVSVAHSAKGNAAYGKGDVLLMMQEKEEAIRLAPFYLDGYLDYIDKLEKVLVRYEETGDFASAEICRGKLMEVQESLEQTKSSASPIAWKIQHKPELDLPDDYQKRVDVLYH